MVDAMLGIIESLQSMMAAQHPMGAPVCSTVNYCIALESVAYIDSLDKQPIDTLYM